MLPSSSSPSSKQAMITPKAVHQAIAASESRARQYIQSQVQLAVSSDGVDKTLKAVIKRQQAAIDKLDPAWKSCSCDFLFV